MRAPTGSVHGDPVNRRRVKFIASDLGFRGRPAVRPSEPLEEAPRYSRTPLFALPAGIFQRVFPGHRPLLGAVKATDRRAPADGPTRSRPRSSPPSPVSTGHLGAAVAWSLVRDPERSRLATRSPAAWSVFPTQPMSTCISFLTAAFSSKPPIHRYASQGSP